MTNHRGLTYESRQATALAKRIEGVVGARCYFTSESILISVQLALASQDAKERESSDDGGASRMTATARADIGAWFDPAPVWICCAGHPKQSPKLRSNFQMAKKADRISTPDACHFSLSAVTQTAGADGITRAFQPLQLSSHRRRRLQTLVRRPPRRAPQSTILRIDPEIVPPPQS